MESLTTYKVFKGLQKPLEFMGLKGRYVWVGLVGAISSILLFIILFISVNFLTALIAFIATPSAIGYWIFKNMKRGLHTKRKDNTVYIVMEVVSLKSNSNGEKSEIRSTLPDH